MVSGELILHHLMLAGDDVLGRPERSSMVSLYPGSSARRAGAAKDR
jgi:hypothetical protein